MSSTPTVEQFDPTIIPFQIRVLKYMRSEFNYSNGACEMLLSGTIGSAKSLLAAHIIVTHVLMHANSQVLVLRRTLKDLKSTIWPLMLAHFPLLTQFLNKSDMKIRLPNGSIIIGSSYDDGKFSKFRSYSLSGVVIEEATEAEDKELYDEVFSRVGRCQGVEENFALLLTNPDSPQHWIYKKFMDQGKGKVFYSKTNENPFIPKWYIENLRQTLDPKRAMRLLEGKWIEIDSESIYYCFGEHNIIPNYEPDFNYPVYISFDFNIGHGKPFSACIAQCRGQEIFVFDEIILDSARTEQACQEFINKEYFSKIRNIIVTGDASGRARDTRNFVSDYDIIENMFKKLKPTTIDVPRSNWAVRERHNTVNAWLKNAHGESRLFVKRECKTVIEGLRMTALRKGSAYIEDDSKAFQHVTTALGYLTIAIQESLTKRQFYTGAR